MIKIGVTACFMYPDPDRIVFGMKSLNYLEKDMGRYLSRPDVMPVLIPDLSEGQLIPFLTEMDGIVLQGGTDLAPQTYGEKPIGKWKGDPTRDAYELKVLDWSIKNDKPVFGICRGFQLMNAYFGGSLYQDILTQKPGSLKHRDAIEYDQVNHEIEFSEGGWMKELYQNEKVKRVNSVHHQGIKDLGNELEVLAISPEDGIIEAFQWTRKSAGRVFGVQWHPEFHFNSKTPVVEPHILYDHFLKFAE